MPVIVIALFFSAAFLCVVGAVAKSRFGNGGVCWLSVIAAVLFMFFASPALLLHNLWLRTVDLSGKVAGIEGVN